MTWSAKSWQAIKPIYNSIIEMPFIKELMDGSLSLEKFQFYIAQDAWYLEHFGRSLALIGARANDIRDALAFIRFAEGAIIVENALHESYFNKYRVTDKGVPEPACHHYVHFLKSTAALEQAEVAVAAVLPCFWIYKQVGDYIYQNQTSGNNPFQEWIETYAGQEFGKLVQQALDICDEMAKNCTKTQQDAMTQAFITATRLEWMFWDSAYRLKQW